jgi:hypothetical protein
MKIPAPPAHIVARLPAYEFAEHALLNSIIEFPAGTEFVRAAWNDASVWPERVQQTYRFGPPRELAGANGQFSYHWVYAASNVITSVWEAGFCANDVTRPGTFFIQPMAAEAMVARLVFSRPLRFIDLAGTAVSKLGIFDAIASPDHEWCQWFGCLLDGIIASQAGQLHGIRYPSRRHTGHDAFAISSRTQVDLGLHSSTSIVKFKDTAEFSLLMDDRCLVLPP